MRRAAVLAAALAAMSGRASAGHGLAGHYRLVDVQDAAAVLLVNDDGRFHYELAYGALDEVADGRWQERGDQLVLTTMPKPVPPEFKPAPVAKPAAGAPFILVVDPDGRGIGGVDFRIGCAAGQPLVDYTQYDGWQLHDGQTCDPRWVELAEPIYGVISPRFAVPPGAPRPLTFVLVPHDMGIFDFTGIVIDIKPDALVMHRGHALLTYRRER